MQLKDYQIKVLERLDTYLAVWKEKRAESLEWVEFQRSKGRTADLRNWCQDAWDEMNHRRLLPTFRSQGSVHIAPWANRLDGQGRPIPNVCMKVPTGGGKTLLAASALERINLDFFERQTGFVLWIVPSDAIYRQTWKSIANREHPYRQMLERASGGRVKVLEKTDNFTPEDVDSYLCVMLLMLQSSARQTKETLRLFRDSGKFTRFFPEVDDEKANSGLLTRVRNLDTNDIEEGPFVLKGLSVKHSLGNALRLVEPIVVIDEGHKAYSETARETLCGFNPRFVLELSATPNAAARHSNILVDVSGVALKDEQMIKLPINVVNEANADWKHTLTAAHEELTRLATAAVTVQTQEGRYIRPIMLIRVDRTGKDQRDGIHVHAEDARDYLTKQLGVAPETIRVKSASTDEIGDEDLLDSLSPVRYIITKDALREGWDCPFAYILVILSKTTARTAITQMVGRVLRQPEARLTGQAVLNECFVYCFDQEVRSAVDSVRQGLEQEGMGDLAAEVKAKGTDNATTLQTLTIPRNSAFSGLRVLLPRVLHRDGEKWRPLDYDRDILAGMEWHKFSFGTVTTFSPDARDQMERTIARITISQGKDLAYQQAGFDFVQRTEVLDEDQELDFAYLVRQLTDVIPNPWEAARIIEETLSALAMRGIEGKRLIESRLFLIKTMKYDLARQVERAAAEAFRAKLDTGEISFRLYAHDERLNWELADTLNLTVSDEDRLFLRKNGEPLARFLYQKLYERELNGLEKEVAWYIDGEAAVQWWHRLVARQDYHLQGWQRNKVYPDFLACLKEKGDGTRQIVVLETKGMQLKGNDDTIYKQRLFDLLSDHYSRSVEAGEMELIQDDAQRLTFRMVFEEDWRAEVSRLIG
jgi:type III restriction enzyme